MITLNPTGAALHARLIAGEDIPLVTLLYMGLTVPQYFALGAKERVWDSQTWAALDVDIGEVDDSSGQRNGLRFALPGITAPQLALALSDDPEGAEVLVYEAICDPDTGAVGDAVLRWSGQVDMPGWQDGARAVVVFTAEHSADLASQPKPSRYTNAEQQRLYAGDTFFDFDSLADGAQLVWPAASYGRV